MEADVKGQWNGWFRRRVRHAGALVLALGAFGATAATGDDAAAQKLIESKCGACHLDNGKLDRIPEIRKSPEGWDMTVVRMGIWHKVELTPDERRQVVKYLADRQGLAPSESAPFRFLTERRPNMQDAPPDSIGIVDTMGCILPEAMKYMVRLVKRLTSLPVEAHTHNDFGMAVATELAAVEAGAEVVHSCANGLGERTGNAALEELIVALHVLYGYETHYKLDKLPELGELVRKLSGLPIAVNKPILGSRNFTRESGIGVDLVVKEPLAMFGTHPSLTGRSGDIVLGKKSGKASITYTLEQMGLTADDEAVAEMLKMVKDASIAKRGLITPDEFRAIADKVLSSVKHPA